MSSVKNIVAGQISKRWPSLFYYAAPREARQGITVTRHGTYIDITRPAAGQKIRISSRNAVYIVDMVSSFDYYFGSATPVEVVEQGKAYRIVDFSTPRYQMVAGFDDFPLMCPSLTEPFITAQQYLDFAELKPGSTVLDLGGYSGLTAIAFSKAVGPTGRVVMLEPDPINYKAALLNIALHERINGLTNITLMQAAVGARTGTLKLSSEGAMGSAVVDAVGDYRGVVTEVECLTLDDIVERNGLTAVDFIKMDIEGSEEPAITSATAFFDRFKPRIIIEPHLVDGTMSDVAVSTYLTGRGYDCSVIDQIGVTLPLVTAVPHAKAA